MKKLVVSSKSTPEDRFIYERQVRGSIQKFRIYVFESGPDMEYPSLQASEIHPYDDADYLWASMKSDGTCRLRNSEGKSKGFIDVSRFSYDEDDYETYDEYMSEIVDHICVSLGDANAEVSPKIMHM